jgi:hypothetical protein
MNLKQTVRTILSETYVEAQIKKGYQPIPNFIKDENGDLLADAYSISNRWMNYFCQILNVPGINDAKGKDEVTVLN